ncbi:hypothetical protein HG536_0B00810 [Torulaspora globosa]|uniref:DNA damage checkpoint protein LCD1 n=1 Tax=Torulaspora globosa TaxID=48254 RepID=A0A7G3ZCI4_9SACH|nr:uncharacterized protein HG536_0B00810 [Torulaspora globosa]QLL31220.1 hypothetical protein HG536_0B00810 [Torulaspora globosa]
MSYDDNGILSDDDDDMLLELSTRPPKLTQNQLATQVPNKESYQTSGNISNDVARAQGEVSILRDKLRLLEEERKRDKERQLREEEKLKASHREELARLKVELQNLEDAKKFLVMEVRKTSASYKPKTAGQSPSAGLSSLTDDTTATENIQVSNKDSADHSSKRRKIVEVADDKKQVKAINRPFNDDSGELFDILMLHRICGVKLRTIQILNCLRLVSTKRFSLDGLEISQGESIGEQLTQYLLQCKKAMTLDTFIENLIRVLSALIQEIMVSDGSNLAIPFLLVMVYQIIIFRPSAIRLAVLKHILNFICELIKAFQKSLKRPLHESNTTNDVEPQIFQYEMIELLVTVYSYDILEASIGVLQSNPSSVHGEVLTVPLLNSIGFVYKLALPISYKPIMSVVFNTVEIINMLAGMVDSSSAKPIQTDPQWWKDCITRLYHMLGKSIDTSDPFNEESPGNFCFSRFHDVYGMVRNIGSNSIGSLISRLIYEDKLQDLPRVILKDDIEDSTTFLDNHDVAVNMERWFLLLKTNILNILENIINFYPQETAVANGEMLIQLTRFMSTQQELMLHRLLGQSSPNLLIRCQLIEYAMALIYRLWMDHPRQITSQHVKEVESELVTSLWRFLAASDSNSDSRDALENQELIDEFGTLTLENRSKYYDDALENAPEYVEEDIRNEMNDQTSKIMQVKYDQVCRQMAQTILETKLDSIISIEGMDSLYVAMGK